MRGLMWLSDWLERIVCGFGRAGAWLALPLVVVILFDILTRKFFWSQQLIANSWAFEYVSSSHLQDWEWHLHTALFLLVLGYTYLRNGHVRVDLVRDKLSESRQVWIEFLGCLLFLLPYTILLLYFAFPFVLKSWTFDEQSQAFTGLGNRWVIKSFLILGFTLALMAGVAVFIRICLWLFGPRARRSEIPLAFLSRAARPATTADD